MKKLLTALTLAILVGTAHASRPTTCNPTGKGDVCKLTQKLSDIKMPETHPMSSVLRFDKVYHNQNQQVFEMTLTTLSSANRAAFSVSGARAGVQDRFCNELKSGVDYDGPPSNAAPDFVKWANLGGQFRVIVFFNDGVKASDVVVDIQGCR